jgi:hypothetical protein
MHVGIELARWSLGRAEKERRLTHQAVVRQCKQRPGRWSCLVERCRSLLEEALPRESLQEAPREKQMHMGDDYARECSTDVGKINGVRGDGSRAIPTRK